MLKFCVVGGIGSIIDLGGAALLHGKFHMEGLEAKAISTTTATIVTYVGSRFWTFKHRENQALGREATIFAVLNLIGLGIAEVVIALTVYGFGLHNQLQYNAASVIGTGLATIFRYFAYRQWVFTAPAEQPASAPDVARFPEHSAWEGDPAFLAAEVAAEVRAPVTASVGSAGWNAADAAPLPPWPSADSAPSWDANGQEPPRAALAGDRSWGTAAKVSPWGHTGEPTQPWVDNSIISNARLASPQPPASDATGPDLIGRAGSADAGARGQGRHRRG